MIPAVQTEMSVTKVDEVAVPASVHHSQVFCSSPVFEVGLFEELFPCEVFTLDLAAPAFTVQTRTAIKLDLLF